MLRYILSRLCKRLIVNLWVIFKLVNKVTGADEWGTIQIDYETIPYQIYYSQRARRLHLRVKQKRIELVVPNNAKTPAIEVFLRLSSAWIKEQHLKIKKHADLFWPPHFLPSESISIEGHKKTIHVIYGCGKPQVRHLSEQLVVQIPETTLLLDYESVIQAALLKAIKKRALERVLQSTEHFCAQLGRWPKSVRVKTQSSRWGSCGIHEDIHINWVLILAPAFVLDYVVAHECCHLFYRNHGVRFWDKVSRLMPDYQQAEHWLRQYGTYLAFEHK